MTGGSTDDPDREGAEMRVPDPGRHRLDGGGTVRSDLVAELDP
jgi:hypothetical protein